MSEIKNGELDQYGAEPFKKQQFQTAGIEGVKTVFDKKSVRHVCDLLDLSRHVQTDLSCRRQIFVADLSAMCLRPAQKHVGDLVGDTF